MVLPLGKDTV